MMFNLNPPDTIRMCPTCQKETIWGFHRLSGHCRCRTCGCNLHTKKAREIKVEDFQKQTLTLPENYVVPEDKDLEIHKLRCRNGQLQKEKEDLKTKIKEQTKHLAILHEKIRGAHK